MSRSRNKGRRSSETKHLRIYWWMFNSPAYPSLDCTCRCGLHELMFNFNGRNNGDIIGSVRWLRDRLGVGINTAVRVYATLQERGFIKVSVKGSFDWKTGARKGEATRWHLTMIEGPNGETPTKDFMTWAPEKQTTDSLSDTPCIRQGVRQNSRPVIIPRTISTAIPSTPDLPADGLRPGDKYS
jgi:DNA-binding transcriptional MocR family regulator